MTSSDGVAARTKDRARRVARRVVGHPELLDAVVPIVEELARFRHDLGALAAADDHIGDRIEELAGRLDAHARQLAEIARLQQELVGRLAALDGRADGRD